MRRIIIIILALLFPVLAHACQITLGFAGEQHYGPTHQGAKAKMAATFDMMQRQFYRLSKCHIVAKPYATVEQLKRAVISKKVDFAYLTPFNMFIVHNFNDAAVPFLTELSVNSKTGRLSAYHDSYLVTREGAAGVNSLNDITLQNIAFLHPSSAGGFVYPIMYLSQQHILQVSNKTQFNFLNSEVTLYQKLFTNALIKVITASDNSMSGHGKRNQTRVLKTFSEIPNSAYLEAKIHSQKIRHAFTVALSNMTKARVFYPNTPVQGLTPSATVNYQSAFGLFGNFCSKFPKYCAP